MAQRLDQSSDKPRGALTSHEAHKTQGCDEARDVEADPQTGPKGTVWRPLPYSTSLLSPQCRIKPRL